MTQPPYPQHLNPRLTPEIWMKSREPFDGPFAQKVLATGTDQQKMLMGAIEKW